MVLTSSNSLEHDWNFQENKYQVQTEANHRSYPTNQDKSYDARNASNSRDEPVNPYV